MNLEARLTAARLKVIQRVREWAHSNAWTNGSMWLDAALLDAMFCALDELEAVECEAGIIQETQQ